MGLGAQGALISRMAPWRLGAQHSTMLPVTILRRVFAVFICRCDKATWKRRQTSLTAGRCARAHQKNSRLLTGDSALAGQFSDQIPHRKRFQPCAVAMDDPDAQPQAPPPAPAPAPPAVEAAVSAAAEALVADVFAQLGLAHLQAAAAHETETVVSAEPTAAADVQGGETGTGKPPAEPLEPAGEPVGEEPAAVPAPEGLELEQSASAGPAAEEPAAAGEPPVVVEAAPAAKGTPAAGRTACWRGGAVC